MENAEDSHIHLAYEELRPELEKERADILKMCFTQIARILSSEAFSQYFQQAYRQIHETRIMKDVFEREVALSERDNIPYRLRLTLKVVKDYFLLSTVLYVPNETFPLAPNQIVRLAVRNLDEFAGIRYKFDLSHFGHRPGTVSVSIVRDIGVIPEFEHQGFPNALFLCSHMVHRIMISHLSKVVSVHEAISIINDQSASSETRVFSSPLDSERTHWTSYMAKKLGYTPVSGDLTHFVYYYT